MDNLSSVHIFFNVFFLIYASSLFISYTIIALLSSYELKYYSKRNQFFNFKNIDGYQLLPSISIIAPSYNEERSIIENIRSLLSLKYPQMEVIIVNDGSTDHTLSRIVEHYSLVKVNYAIEKKIDTKEIKGIYKSTNLAYSNLIVIDKENGGKADALNAGVNVSRSDLFLAIDVDCILEHDALSRMVKPFIEEDKDRKVIASGGVIRVANSCEVKDGRIVKVNYPTNLWAKFQVLEYFRAFTLGRMAWGKLNGLLIISGAFGLFDRKLVLAVGGYDNTTVGEDLELVIRMRKYMHRVKKKPYKVAFIPDPLCWTEVPTTLKVLSRQRSRWTRGLIDSLIKHKDMLLNPRYGRIGMISFPYWLIFEWMAPIIQVVGISYFLLLVLFGRIHLLFFLLFLLFVFSFSLLYSLFAVYKEKYYFSKYKGIKVYFKIVLVSMIEMFIYHPINLYNSLVGNYEFFIKRNKKDWGIMTRIGFESKDKKNEK